jgi:hypothetical protein
MKPFHRSFDSICWLGLNASADCSILIQSRTGVCLGLHPFLRSTPVPKSDSGGLLVQNTPEDVSREAGRHLHRKEAPMIPFTRWLDMVKWIRTVNGDCSVYIQTAGGQRSTYTYHYQPPPLPPLTRRKGPARRVIPRRED